MDPPTFTHSPPTPWNLAYIQIMAKLKRAADGQCKYLILMYVVRVYKELQDYLSFSKGVCHNIFDLNLSSGPLICKQANQIFEFGSISPRCLIINFEIMTSGLNAKAGQKFKVQ